MAPNASTATGQASGLIHKLQSSTDEVLNAVKTSPEFRNAEHEAKERRIAQMMADQMLMPMTVNEISVHGAKNIRRSFLDPIFSPLLRDGSNAPSTVGDVMAKLQTASSKLSGLRELPAHQRHRTEQNHLLTARRDPKRAPRGILVTG
ncbi:hypothetical protein J3458_000860 [Metarhizium acridum]|uniref:uncharacterized protein n=1 Tax=Metarhizium acridum TaxID=92637 RepID=UPI001C6B0581|nr:hypothetical protein J3458_000860 [Metarhizium acridum]